MVKSSSGSLKRNHPESKQKRSASFVVGDHDIALYYGDGKVAFEIEDAAVHSEVLEVVTAFWAEEVLLDELFEGRLIFRKLDWTSVE